MANIAQSPQAVVDQAAAQPVLTPLTASAVILVLTIDDGGESTVHDLFADLSGLARTVAFRSLEGGLAVIARSGQCVGSSFRRTSTGGPASVRGSRRQSAPGGGDSG